MTTFNHTRRIIQELFIGFGQFKNPKNTAVFNSAFEFESRNYRYLAINLKNYKNLILLYPINFEICQKNDGVGSCLNRDDDSIILVDTSKLSN